MYGLLEDYGVPESDRQKDVSELFPKWINKFNEDNTNAFVDPSWTYFCQFTNETVDKKVVGTCDPVKLYIPLDSKHLEEGVNQIFEFCSRNNIIHHSKVAKKIRSDNVVLRVVNIEDANSIIEYIDNNPFFYDNELEANPFLYDDSFMGLAVDGNYSYNSQTSRLIEKYMIKKQLFGGLDDVNIKDFNQFVKGLEKDENENIQEINELIECATNGRNDLGEYVEHFEKTNKKFKKVISEEMLENAVFATVINHGTKQAVNALMLYLHSNNASGFSRFYELDKSNTNWRDEIVKIDAKKIKNYFDTIFSGIDINGQVEMYVAELANKYSLDEDKTSRR